MYQKTTASTEGKPPLMTVCDFNYIHDSQVERVSFSSKTYIVQIFGKPTSLTLELLSFQIPIVVQPPLGSIAVNLPLQQAFRHSFNPIISHHA